MDIQKDKGIFFYPIKSPEEWRQLLAKPNKNYAYRIYSLVKSADDSHSLKPSDYVIRSEEYGIPQARHRVILLGIRSDLNLKPSCLAKRGEKVPMWYAISDLSALRSRLSKEKDSYEC